jgi:D-alanine-D-alanine ligase
MNEKPTIAFITGGYSTEAVISYKSAITIENNIDREKFNVYKIDIRPDGWFCEVPGNGKTTIDRNDFTLAANGKKITFDAVLVGIHLTLPAMRLLQRLHLIKDIRLPLLRLQAFM